MRVSHYVWSTAAFATGCLGFFAGTTRQLDDATVQTIPITTSLATFDTLLEIAPPSVIIPLLGALLLPPIAWTIAAPQPMVHLYGITGSPWSID